MTSNNQPSTGKEANSDGQFSASNGQNDWGGQSYDDLASQWGTPANYSAVTPPVEYAAPQQPVQTKKKSRVGLIIGVLVALLIVIAVLLILVGRTLGWFGGGAKTDSDSTPTTESAATTELQTGGASLGEGQLTGGETLGGSQLEEGDSLTGGLLDEELDDQTRVEFTNFSPGTTITSWEFSQEVGNAFVEHYERTGEYDVPLRVASPVTGETYTMTCNGSRSSVTCTGGNNAVVKIS